MIEIKIYLNAYLQRNLGDDLFLYILLNRYKNHDFYTITTDKTYKNNFDNLHVFDLKYLVKALKKLSLKKYLSLPYDIVLTLGGSMFIENPGDIHKNYSFGKKEHYILGVNFGPYKTETYFNKIKSLFTEAADVCFREKYSYKLFEDLPQTRVESDIVFSLPLDDIKITDEHHVVVSVISCKDKLSAEYETKYEQAMVDIVNYFISLQYKVTLMSFCEFEGDSGAVERILSKLECNSLIQRYDYKGNIKEALNIIASSSVVIGSRFHANVIGLLMGKTVIPFLYSEKTKNVLSDIGFSGMIIDIKDLDHFNAQMLDAQVLGYHLDVEQAKLSAAKHFLKLDERLLK